MEREWTLGEDMYQQDALLDGITFDDVIQALHAESKVNVASARRVLKEILEIQLQDMNFLFEKNLDIILSKAMEGRN